ncbi:hypothetical protein ACFX2A_008889 [Malus domestica]
MVDCLLAVHQCQLELMMTPCVLQDGQLRGVSCQHSAELKSFLEVEFGPNLRPIPLPDKTKEDIMLFFKLYELEKQELRFVGRLSLKSFYKASRDFNKVQSTCWFFP